MLSYILSTSGSGFTPRSPPAPRSRANDGFVPLALRGRGRLRTMIRIQPGMMLCFALVVGPVGCADLDPEIDESPLAMSSSGPDQTEGFPSDFETSSSTAALSPDPDLELGAQPDPLADHCTTPYMENDWSYHACGTCEDGRLNSIIHRRCWGTGMNCPKECGPWEYFMTNCVPCE